MEDKELAGVTKTDADSSRRRFLKGAVYAAPVILTLKAAPGFAGTGSQSYKPDKHKGKRGKGRGRPRNGIGPF